jgi:hypothetical protein
MIRWYKQFMMAAALLSLLVFSRCSDDATPGEEKQVLAQLDGGWKLTTGKVTINGVDVTGAFRDMAITFNKDMTYSVENPLAPIWPASGSFAIEKRDSGFMLVRDDGREVSVEAISATHLVLSLQHTLPGGRSNSVGGGYRFEMNR